MRISMRMYSLVIAALAASGWSGCSKAKDAPPPPVKAAEPAPAAAKEPAPAPAPAPVAAVVKEKPTVVAERAASKCIKRPREDLDRTAKFAGGDAKKGCDELTRALQDVIASGEKQLGAINQGSIGEAAAGYKALGQLMVEGAGKFRALSGLDPSVGDARDALAASFENMGKLMIAFAEQLQQENGDGADDVAQRMDGAAQKLDAAVNGFVAACGG
jgi:hypothetical protein